MNTGVIKSIIVTAVVTTALVTTTLKAYSGKVETENGLWIHYTIEEDFDTIKEYIEEGITNQGLVVAHRSNVSRMLQRTGKDLATKVKSAVQAVVRKDMRDKVHTTTTSIIDIAKEQMNKFSSDDSQNSEASNKSISTSVFMRSEIIEFCSAKLSRKMTNADPANVIFCPYSIAIYTTTASPDIVNISYLQLSAIGSKKSRSVLLEVENMLESIILEAIE